jgi:uncharacterized membrane protein AbrB (regulator of aidB expression)
VILALFVIGYLTVTAVMFGALFGSVLDDQELSDTTEGWFVGLLCVLCGLAWPVFVVWVIIDRMKGKTQ